MPDLEQVAWEWGGIVGIDPTDRTLRELHWALMAHRRDAWDQTSQLLAFIAAHGGAKDVSPADLHPYREGRKKRSGWADVFGAGKKMAAEKRAKRARGKMADGPTGENRDGDAVPGK